MREKRFDPLVPTYDLRIPEEQEKTGTGNYQSITELRKNDSTVQYSNNPHQGASGVALMCCMWSEENRSLV